MGRPLAVIAWLVVVVACSTGVWAVISNAGEEVATSSDVVPRPVPLPTAPSTTGQSSPPAHRTPSTTASPSSADDREQPTRPVRPTRDPSSRDSATPSPRPDREVRRTWDSAAGSLVVACRGGSITLGGAHANSGWSLEVDDRGPEEVKVEFESNGEADDVRVEASCVDGQPRFSD